MGLGRGLVHKCVPPHATVVDVDALVEPPWREGEYLLTRLDAVKQMFHAFVNRSQAPTYNCRSSIALVLFGDEV